MTRSRLPAFSSPPLTPAGFVTSGPRLLPETMPEQPNPRPYDPRPSDYRPEAHPTESRVYAEMAEDSARHLARTFGTVGDPPIRYCAAEDLAEAVAIRRDELARLAQLRLKHEFCRMLVTRYGVPGSGLWEAVQTGAINHGAFGCTAWTEAAEGFVLMVAWTDLGDLPVRAAVVVDAVGIGEADDWEHAVAMTQAHREGRAIAAPVETVWQERKRKEEEIAAAFVDFEGPRRKAAASVASAYGVAPSTVRRYVERVAERAAAQIEQDDAREAKGE